MPRIMMDDRPLAETSQGKSARRRRMSLVVLAYGQRIGIGFVIIVMMVIFGCLTMGVFN
jgi:hypothetical protein